MNDRFHALVRDADKKIGAKIRARRVAIGLSEMDVAAHLELTLDAYIDTEEGHFPLSAYDIHLLARLFGVSVEELMPEEHETFR